MAPRLRLTSGLLLLEEWSSTATQADRNAVYEVLFTVTESSIFESCDFVRVTTGSPQIVAIVNPDLMIRIWLPGNGSFGIAYIGPFTPNTPAEIGGPSDEP